MLQLLFGRYGLQLMPLQYGNSKFCVANIPAKDSFGRKSNLLTAAKSIFGDTDIQITDQGQHHLGVALDSRDFAEEFVSEKVTVWSSEANVGSLFQPFEDVSV